MRLTTPQINRLVKMILQELQVAELIQAKVPDDKLLKRGAELIAHQYQLERQLDQDVQKMMDELERQNPGSFERGKMFPMLKKRMAKERKLVL
jgi:hypothetical protein